MMIQDKHAGSIKHTGREQNYNLLRIIATIAVIVIHVSAMYTNALNDEAVFGELYRENILTTSLYNALSRFAVPCFVMLSGAFILANERNAEYRYFYKKSFKNIGIPTVIFSVLYLAYAILTEGVLKMLNKGEWEVLLAPVKNFIKGEPYYHMWYLYMLIGIYLLAPIVIRFKNSINEKAFSKVTWCFLVLACLSDWTSQHKLYWDIGYSFCYLGYFMIGYELRKWCGKRKNNLRGILLVIAGVAVELIISYFYYKNNVAGIADGANGYSLIEPYAPGILLASILIFAGFSLVNVKKDFSKLSSQTFMIYLFHAGVWSLLSEAVDRIWGIDADNRIVIPVGILLTFILSYICAVIYNKLWKKLDKDEKISEKSCKILKI